MRRRKYPSESPEKLALRREERQARARSELERLASINDRSYSHLRKLATLMDIANDPAAAAASGERKRIRYIR